MGESAPCGLLWNSTDVRGRGGCLEILNRVLNCCLVFAEAAEDLGEPEGGEEEEEGG